MYPLQFCIGVKTHRVCSTEKHKCVHLCLIVFLSSFTDWQCRGCHDGIDQQQGQARTDPTKVKKKESQKKRTNGKKNHSNTTTGRNQTLLIFQKKKHLNDAYLFAFFSCDWWWPLPPLGWGRGGAGGGIRERGLIWAQVNCFCCVCPLATQQRLH